MLADTITIGNLTVPNQPMALATHFQGQWAAPWDGLMGMGCESIHQNPSGLAEMSIVQSLSATGEKNFFENLVESNQLASNVFTFYLARGRDSVSARKRSVPERGPLKAYRPIGRPWDAPKPASTKKVDVADTEDGQKLVAAASGMSP